MDLGIVYMCSTAEFENAVAQCGRVHNAFLASMCIHSQCKV